MVLLTASVSGLLLEPQWLPAAQAHANAVFDSSSTTDEKTAGDNEQGPPTPSKMDETIDRIIKREHEEIAAFDLYSPVIETYIQEVKFNQAAGAVPKSDYYFLGQANFRGRLKVHTTADNSRRGSLMWSFDPAGFLQMIYVDSGEFDKAHYRFKYLKCAFWGDVKCIAFEVSPVPKAKGARFSGVISVEDHDYTIVRFNGEYTPAIHFSLPALRFMT